MNGYELSRRFWDFAFENTGKIKPIHTSIYFFAIEHCNRLGWKKNFGLPTSMVLEAISVKSYSVYKKAFDDLVDYGFFEVVQYSKNQYSSNIIALQYNSKARGKALDKATIKHTAKQGQSTGQSTGQSMDSIDKPLTKEPLTNKQERKRPSVQDVTDCINSTLFQKGMSKNDFPVEQLAEKFWNNYETKGWQINGQQMVKWKPKVGDWINEHLKDPERLLGKNHGKITTDDAKQMDIAILKHMQSLNQKDDVQLENDYNKPSENNRLR